MVVKQSILAVVILFTGLISIGQRLPSPPPLPLSTQQQFVQSKNYFLLTLLAQSQEVKKIIEHDPILLQIAAAKKDSLTQSLLSCKNSTCFAEKVKFSDVEIKLISNQLLKLYQPENTLGLLVKQLILSGKYSLYKDLKPEELLQKAWEQDANGINRVIDIYALGKKPNYPAIDSVSFDVKNKQYATLLYDLSASVLEDCITNKLFFFPILTYALQCLEIKPGEQIRFNP